MFNGLTLLDKSENTFCVPVFCCMSVIAGLIASWLLSVFLDHSIESYEIAGALIMVAAILFLTVPPLLRESSSASE